jgi:Leucine-rich repeat (LRR) protein
MSDDESLLKTILHSWHENWLLAKIAFFLGSFLALAGLALLGWSEYSGVKKAQSLEQGANTVASISADKVEPGNEGKLVHVVGPATTKEMLTDPEFELSVNAIRLSRKIEMHQWQEKKESKKKDKETIVTYSYDRVWSGKLIDSSRFNNKGQINPAGMPFEDKTWQAKEVSCGAFALAPTLIDKIRGDERFPVTDAAKGKLPDRVTVSEGLFYQGADPNNPNIGDAKIEYKATKPGTITVLAKQAGNGLQPYQESDGNTIEEVRTGTLTAQEIIESAKSGHAFLTWILRAIAFMILAFGIYLVAQPNVYRSDSIPLVGDILALGGICFAVVMGLAVSLLLSAVVLIMSRPIVALPLLVIAAVLVVVFRFIGARKQSKADGLDKLTPEAGKVARQIRKRGGRVSVYEEGANVTVTVSLDGKKFNDDFLAELNALPRITDLSLWNTSINGTGLAKLQQAKTLQSLSVRGELSVPGLQTVGAMTGLKKLDLGESKLADQSLPALKGLTKLEEADLSDTLLTDAGLAHLKNWVSLQKLTLGGGSFTGVGLDNLKDLKQLKTLWVMNTKLTDPGMAGLKNLRGLKELYVGINDINGNGLGYLQGLTQLEVLDLSSSKVADKGLAFLGKCVKLRELNLQRSKVGDAGMAHLKALPALKKIDLNRTAVSDQGAAQLGGIVSLEELCLDRTKVTDACLQSLGRLVNLKHLHLDNNNIKDAGLVHLNRLTNLNWVTLSNTKVTQKRIDEVQTALPGANIELTGWRGMLDDIEDQA